MGWKVSPRGARSQHPEDAIKDAPIIDAGYAARLGREHRANDAPLLVGELIPHDYCLPVGSRSIHATASGSWAEADSATRTAVFLVLTQLRHCWLIGFHAAFTREPLFGCRGTSAIAGHLQCVVRSGRLPHCSASVCTHSLASASVLMTPNRRASPWPPSSRAYRNPG